MPVVENAPIANPNDVIAAAQQAVNYDLNVLDTSILDKEQRTIQHLQNTTILKAERVTPLQTLKRLNRFDKADYSGLGEETNKKILAAREVFDTAAKTKSFRQLIDDGDVHTLFENVLTALIDFHNGQVAQLDEKQSPNGMSTEAFNILHKSNAEKAEKYSLELKYLQDNKGTQYDAITALAAFPQAEQAIKTGYLPMGELATVTGMIDGPVDFVRDAVQDVLANAAAHSMNLFLQPFKKESDGLLDRWKQSPALYATAVRALAKRISATTQPLASISVKDAGDTPELAQIQALKSLLSAQLHAATSGTDDPAALANIEKQAKGLIKEYQQAALSLVDHFLADGPAATDARMRTVRAQLQKAAKNQGVELMPFERAEAKAATLARESAQDLAQLTVGNPLLENKLRTLLTQINPDLGKEKLAHKPQLIAFDVEAAIGTEGFAGKYAAQNGAAIAR